MPHEEEDLTPSEVVFWGFIKDNIVRNNQETFKGDTPMMDIDRWNSRVINVYYSAKVNDELSEVKKVSYPMPPEILDEVWDFKKFRTLNLQPRWTSIEIDLEIDMSRTVGRVTVVVSQTESHEDTHTHGRLIALKK